MREVCLQSPNQRKSAIAFGIALIAAVFLMETLIASRIAVARPDAVPYVVGLLIVVAIGAVAAGVFYRMRR